MRTSEVRRKTAPNGVVTEEFVGRNGSKPPMLIHAEVAPCAPQTRADAALDEPFLNVLRISQVLPL